MTHEGERCATIHETKDLFEVWIILCDPVLGQELYCGLLHLLYNHDLNPKTKGECGVAALTALFSVSNCSVLRPSIFPLPLPFPDNVEGGTDVEPNTSSGTRKLALLPRLFTLPLLGSVFVAPFPRAPDESSASGSLSFELDVRCNFPAFLPKITNGGFRGVGSSGRGSLITGGGMEGIGTILLATNDSSGGVREGPVEVH